MPWMDWCLRYFLKTAKAPEIPALTDFLAQNKTFRKISLTLHNKIIQALNLFTPERIGNQRAGMKLISNQGKNIYMSEVIKNNRKNTKNSSHFNLNASKKVNASSFENMNKTKKEINKKS